MSGIVPTLKRFNAYQQERFPLIILTLSFLPAVLSSVAVTSGHQTIFNIGGALLASVAYLLHVRILDEYRDFEHDNTHHQMRPIQSGIISKEELLYVDLVSLVIFLVIAALAGVYAFVVAAVMLAYSYLAGKEFFLGEDLRKHFFTYNGINLVQMFLLQLFVYTVFANPFLLGTIVFVHFLFTAVGTVAFEFIRKLKIPGDDGTGQDTYTWHMGFEKALIVYLVLLFSNAVLFFLVTTFISLHALTLLIFSLGLALLTALSAFAHWVQRTHRSDQLMQLSFLILYGIFNVAIYFLKFY